MIIPVAQHHGMQHLWITCQPDNVASRRTLERLGAECVGVVDVPADYPLDAGAVRQKMCFRLELATGFSRSFAGRG
jgi:tagatose 1,6-diphosphate aldolase